MSEDLSFDLVIIGSGPGGYTGAIRASQLGLKTAIVEKDSTFGGTCLNVGCIPSKALLDSSEHYHVAQHELAQHGVDVSGVTLQLDKLIQRKNDIVKSLTDGVAFLMKKNKVQNFHGFGKITGQNEVTVKTTDGPVKLQAKNIMLATGSVANELPFLKYDEKKVVSSTGALSLEQVPKKLLVIGAGVIGLELGSVWNRLGAEVTVLEYANKICGPMDAKTSKKLQSLLKKQGLNIITKAKVTGADIKPDATSVTYEDMKSGDSMSLDADVVLVATGRRPFSDGLGMEELGIEKNDRGFVLTNNRFQTKFPNVYAIGDLTPGPMLAHKAEEEGVAVAEIIAGNFGHVNYDTVPSVVYTWPEMASVGKTEEDLKTEGRAYNAGQFPFTANGRAKAMASTDGHVKVLADKTTDQILGVHILGPRASDMISEAVIAMEFAGSAEDLALSFHAHPTLSEVMREAALDVHKRARQM
ncbi:MAG: dihydrolipoyl dehydrogenase [Bdellovibrionaceae bacterium]|jgi:dihydrolipoamide dehydrogenase|nr:dihydrolipoyl dehydrogenase [Pseudobdellovibrionaceae bacterium]